MDKGRFSLLQLLPLGGRGGGGGGNSSSDKKGGGSSLVRGRMNKSSSSLISLMTPSVDSISLAPRQSPTFFRRSKSAISLRSLSIIQTNGSDYNSTEGEDSSSSSSFTSYSRLVTSEVILQLQEFDDDLELIGCHHHTCTEELNNNRSSSSSSSPRNRPAVIERVDRINYRKICFIGRGCYADVYMVTNQNTRETFALKSLNPNRIKDPETLLVAATDLAMEAIQLNELNHENIIQLKGICSSSFSQSFKEGMDDGYFLILDLLKEVLSDRLERWRNDNRLASYENKWSLMSRPKLNIKDMYGRLENVSLGIVKGMIYLHGKGIVLRDLKPTNVGFDEDGKVRLFDFGMARKLEDCDNDDICGSPR
jgi:hypothetical protein